MKRIKALVSSFFKKTDKPQIIAHECKPHIQQGYFAISHVVPHKGGFRALNNFVPARMALCECSNMTFYSAVMIEEAQKRIEELRAQQAPAEAAKPA